MVQPLTGKVAVVTGGSRGMYSLELPRDELRY